MSWLQILLICVGVYLVIGFVAMFFLLQTPYAENPLWTMILLWPLYFFGN